MRLQRLRWLLALFVLLSLAGGADAQRRRGRGKGNAPQATRPASEPKLPPIYLPGFDQPGKKPAPVGPKPKPKAPQKAQPPKPPDPMKAADQITAAADHLAAVEEARLQFLREHFHVCDLDASGWLSLREVEVTLSLGRGEYRRMDGNQDGRLDAEEFAAQGKLLLARLGATAASMDPGPMAEPEELAEPRAEALSEPALQGEVRRDPDDQAQHSNPFEPDSMAVRPGDLLGRYDVDSSSGIDATEIEKLFVEAGLVLSPELVVAQMDPDDSGQLESSELVAIAWLVSRNVPEVLRPAPVAPTLAIQSAATEAEPLAQPSERSALLPTHFGRLDPGHDGFIEEADLRALQSPSRLDLRFRALLSAMDKDGDGRLSEAEFRASMGVDRR